MDEEEVEKLTVELRTLLDGQGFGWARQQAESALEGAWDLRTLARALIAASEAVTIDLAEAELAMFASFGADGVEFKADESTDPEGARLAPPASATTFGQFDPLGGSERRAVLEEQADRRDAFKKLKDQLDDFL